MRKQTLLPTPDNLRRWGLKRNVACGLCGRNEVTLSHVLGGCDWVRETENKHPREDRYTWRHNNILYLLSRTIKEQMNMVKKFPEKKATDPLIKFARAGAGVCKSSTSCEESWVRPGTGNAILTSLSFALSLSKYLFFSRGLRYPFEDRRLCDV